MRRLLALSFISLGLLAPRDAAALEDFATCAPDLPACSDEVNACCERSFDEADSRRAVIIPMDRCHQQIASSGKEGPPAQDSPAWCGAKSPALSADQGMIHAYGLVYRLMQQGIPVYWIINPTKDPPHLTDAENASAQTYTERDVDLWVLSPGTAAPTPRGSALVPCGVGCTDPVRRLNPATMLPINDSYNFTTFPVRGSAWVIAPEDRARFDAFVKRTGEFAGLAGNVNYDFSAVDMYEVNAGAVPVYQDFRTAGPNYELAGTGVLPLSVTVDYSPPRVARLSPAGVSETWLADAKLKTPADYPACLTADFTPADAVYCDVRESDIRGGALVSGEFQWAWIDNWSDNKPCSNDAKTEQVDKVREFMTAIPGVRPGGHVLFMDAVIGVVESPECGERQPAGVLGTGIASINQTPVEPLILRYPNNNFLQWGDLPTTFASGSTSKWRYFGGGALGYDPAHSGAEGTLVRLVSEDSSGAGNGLCSNHVSTAACDVFGNSNEADTVDVALYLRYQDNPRNGLVFYQGGNNINGRTSHKRLILNSLIVAPAGTLPLEPPVIREVSRSSPIVAQVSGVEAQYQGTYEVPDPFPEVTTFENARAASTFQFPYTKGHLRAYPTSSVSATASNFEDVPALFDAASDGMIPPASATGCGTPFTSSCRTVFTTVAQPDATGLVQRPDPIYFHTGNLEQIKPLLAPALTDALAGTLISRILAGVKDGATYRSALGGIDRSTMAVIEPSPFIPPTSGPGARPTMIYVGALDGMLHAICAEARGPCTTVGQELWAFIPRTQLPYLRLNTQRIDGSPKVADVFDDFTGDGAAEWRTILTFQTGAGAPGDPDRAPAVFAIDITNPASPTILWERTTPADRGDVEQGLGLNLAMAPVRAGGAVQNLTFVQTNNGGLGAAGFWLGGVRTTDGTLLWEVEHLYPLPRTVPTEDFAVPPVPTTGIPSGVAAFDREGTGFVTHLAVPSLYGDMWLIEAADGENPYGTSPLFRFSGDYHPLGATPTIYADLATGRMHAAFVSGGYADPIAATWIKLDQDQYAVSVALDANAASVPMDERADSGDYGGDRAFVQNIGAGVGYAQAIVAGNELFITADTTDVNLITYGSTASGTVRRFSLSGGGQVGDTLTIAGGASSVDVDLATQNIFVGAGGSAQRIGVEAAFGSATEQGRTIELNAEDATTRLLWISS